MIKQKQIYQCPVCKGTMYLKVAGKSHDSYVCEICGSLLMVDVKKKSYEIKVGEVKIFTDNKKVANILKREYE